ncbi:MAG TPA: hypothetical protein VMD99_06680 [Terriglobales bacterium]|nr:hypothetical protein [Terriglobales bacterium]
MGWKMYGRSDSCLLATLLLILTPTALLAQSEHANPSRDLSFPISPPHLPLPPTNGPGTPIRPPVAPPRPAPITIGLAQLTQAAGMIFSGTVTAIAHHPATRVRANEDQASEDQAIATVAITFHVNQAIRGVTPGEDFTILQWIGLWSSGQRYRIGDRVLLFLYPPSKLGLTSCVGAGLGRFIIDPWGNVFFSAQQLSAFRTDPLLAGKPHVSFSDFASAVSLAQPRPEEAK